MPDGQLLEKSLIIGESFLGRRKAGCGGQRSGQDADSHGGIDTGQPDDQRCREGAETDDDHRQEYIGFRILLQAMEEIRSGDEADTRDKADQSDVLDQ